MTKTLGLIGSGMIGGTLARLAITAGLEVVLSNSRGPESLADLVTELGDRARAASPAEAAEAGDLVVATIPLHAYDKLPASALTGKTVIDTMNYRSSRDGHIAELDSNKLTASELVQRHLVGSQVVKAYNNIVFHHLLALTRPSGAADRSALPIAGDDAAAKAEVARLLDTLGYDTVDMGTLADSWRSAPTTPVYCAPYMPTPPEGLEQGELRRWIFQSAAIPAPAGRIRELVDSAVRGQVSVNWLA